MSKAAKTTANAGSVTKPTKLLTLGDYSLWAMPARNHEIRFWNPATKRVEYKSAGTRDTAMAIKKLEKLYHGDGFCPHCGQAVAKDETEGGDSVVRVIDVYQLMHGDEQISGQAIADKLAHVKRYIGDKPLRVGSVNEEWIKGFRNFMLSEPFYVGKGPNRRAKYRKASTVEGSVAMLAAAIRHSKLVPQFKTKQLIKLSGSVDLRADVPLLAAMFRYALEGGEKRANLLNYLRLAVATWGRPEAVLEADLTPSAKQWLSAARVFRLNPEGREQNKKFRAEVPIGELAANWLDSLPKQPIFTAAPSLTTWRTMMKKLQPGALSGEAGMKLIRRSIAQLVLNRIGSANWTQGEFYGGWKRPKGSTSGIYAHHDVTHMGLALNATNDIIGEIEALVPGAYSGINASITNVIPMGHNLATGQ